MKKENLSDAFTLIDDKIITDTQKKRHVSKYYKQKRVFRSCVAAFLTIAISITAIAVIPKLLPKTDNPVDITQQNNKQNQTDENLDPNLPVLDATVQFGNMGFESYMVHDISDLVNANPWTEDCDIKTLPVYKNTLNLSERYDITNIDSKKMNELILDVAKRFNLKENEFEITTDTKAYTDSLFIKTDAIEIRVDPELTATITFDPEFSLPNEYNFSYHANYNDTLEVAEYFKKEYKNIINFQSPKINVTGGDYDIYDNQTHYIEFFDDSGEITQDIINYSFNRAAFYCNEKKQLYMIRIFRPDLSEKIGNYPIITKAEATELLSNGNYASSVPPDYEMKTENIEKVELIYRNTYWIDKIYMPYYKFYIELPERENWHGNGEKVYGAYYVPAVDSKYLENMPTYNGEFN